MIRFENASHSLALDAGHFSAQQGQLRLQTDRATEFLNEARQIPSEGDWKVFAMGELRLRLKVDPDGNLWLEIDNASPRSVDLHFVSVLFEAACFHHSLQAREYRQLIHSQDFNLSGVKAIHVPVSWQTTNPESFLVTVFSHDPSGQALLAGAMPPFGAAFTSIRLLHSDLHMQGTFGFEIRFDFKQRLTPGSTTRTAGVVFRAGTSGEALLQAYGQLLGESLEWNPKPRITGWNSWDYYMGAVQRRHLDENLAAFRDRLGQTSGTIVIDDGWECAWGVWEPNWKFPEGIADFCDSVRQAGFQPGIWTAPLMCGIFTPLYFEHPDWMAKDAAGNVHLENLPYGQMAILDITHPEVREYLRGVYQRLRDEGVAYFKCDFTQMALGASRFYDPSVGRNELIRRTFELIRETIGPDRYLLACGAPFESVLGIVDANRAACDVRTFWSHIRNIVRTLAARCWMSSATRLDPDFAVVRCGQTTCDSRKNPLWPQSPEQLGLTWMTGQEMNLDEAKVMALAVCLTGGDIVLSDALTRLNATGLNILKTCIEANLAPAHVLNLFTPGQEDTPIFVSQNGNQTVIGVFNLSDAPRTLCLTEHLAVKAGVALDFWTAEPTAFDPQLPLTIPPRSVKGLRYQAHGA